MLKKINILILASIIGLLALSAIQGYLINNTYKLKKTAFITETRKSISRVDDFSPELDSINDIWQDYFLNLLADYKRKTISKTEILPRLKAKTDSLNESYKANYKRELTKKGLKYGLKFQKKIKTIILLDSIKNDTIFNHENTSKIHLLGEHFDKESAHKVSNSMWLTDHSFERSTDSTSTTLTYDLHFETEDFMNIEGWERIVIIRMKWLLICSIFIFLFVFGLLFYSIKNLINQKKIADIKTDFVNNITHELKTPLATLSLATKMLKKDNIKGQPLIVNSTVSTIERQNKRLQKLIDQVLNNSLGYKEITLKKEPVDLKGYINTILDDFMLSVKDKNVALTRNINNANAKVSIDRFYFTTALFNILENAIKYGGDTINVEVSVTQTHFSISITDNGLGISSKNQKQLFDKFYRAGNKEIHNVKGLGLGLYYTNQIVKAHVGQILIKSNEGEGATFTIKIPLH